MIDENVKCNVVNFPQPAPHLCKSGTWLFKNGREKILITQSSETM